MWDGLLVVVVMWWWCECELSHRLETLLHMPKTEDGLSQFASLVGRGHVCLFGPQREDDQEGASEEEEEEERWIWEGRRGKEHRVLVCYVLLHTLHDHSDKLMNTLVNLVESRRAVVVCMVCFSSLPSFSSSSLPTLSPPFPTHAHTQPP